MYYSIFRTKAGWVGLEYSEAGLRRLVLPVAKQDNVKKQLLVAKEGRFVNRDYPGDLIYKIKSYFDGKPVHFDCQLDLSSATAFQRSVWKAIMNIPRGQVRSYRWVASQIGNDNASRAVGQALARNPLPVIIPCHRVIYHSGKTGGFSAKSSVADIKRVLLRLEGVDIMGANPAFPVVT